ncbi:ABC transporter transmembrane domain-containing protein [Flaviflexus massiliensis]|uniref:ABC transporter transmembrane domain-containing protein n=1 Tax=Flaviflexus massiliensis TaxID=1522309 RepID=UPI0006D58F71|nr:ABC transporter ATP-binding protein [Flaviflexus massiliensis]
MSDLITSSKKELAIGTISRTVQEVVGAITPVVLGIALDSGIKNGATSGVWIAAAWLAVLAIVQAGSMALGHGFEILAWMRTALRSITQIHNHVTRTGPAVLRTKSSGEVVATAMSDAEHVGNLVEFIPRLIGGIFAFLTVGIVLLNQHVGLGMVVMIGIPIITFAASLLIKPLQNRQQIQRDEQGKLTALGADTVAGLRVLRGIGGEEQFAKRYAEQSQKVRTAGNAVARLQSWIDGLQILIPGIFTAFVLWQGARLAMDGDLTIGQFTALFGLTVYLVRPIQIVMMVVTQFGRARVGARKMFNIFLIQPISGTLDERIASESDPRHPEQGAGAEVSTGSGPAANPFFGEIVDQETGIAFTPGIATALVSSATQQTAELAERLARIDDERADVTISGTDVRDLPLNQVRHNILLARATPELFGGQFRSVIDAATPYTIVDRPLAKARAEVFGPEALAENVPNEERDDEILSALMTADSHDVLSSLDGSLSGEVTEKARSLSGGQRQRSALARAILQSPPVLILVEPTSAVDSHTEDRIAQRLTERRKGLTTIITSGSPLILNRVDEVILVEEGREVIRGSHDELLARASAGDPAAQRYEWVITRQTGEES